MQVLLLTMEGQIEGIEGSRSWWDMPVEESKTSMEARQYC